MATGKAYTTGGVTVRVKYDHLPTIAKKLHPAVERFVAKAAYDIEAHAKVGAPYYTGFLSNSIHAHRVGPAHWRVTVGAHYGAYQEFGTRFIPAHPYMIPAFERVIPSFMRAMKGLSKELVG